MLKSTIFICIIIQCLISCSLVLSNEDNIIYSERDINNDIEFGSEKTDEFNESMDQDTDEDDLNQVEDFIDPHSFFYDRQNKVMDNTVISLKKSDKICNQEEPLKTSLEECERLKIYYVRLIKMLLINSNLKKGKVDDLVGHIFIKGTEMQIEKLRKVEIGDYSLKEIDLILSEILLEPFSFDTINFNGIIESVFKFVNSYIEVIIIASGALITVILCRIMPYHRMMFFIIVIGLSVSYFMTYLQLLTEAEIKFAATQVQYVEMPESCKPQEMSWLKRIYSGVFGGHSQECEKYYEVRMGKPSLQVTPVLVLSHFFFEVLLHPASLLGEGMSKFVNSATAEFPPFLQYFMKILLFILLPILTVIGIIFLRVSSIEFGFLRGFTCSFSTPKTDALPQDDQKRQRIDLIREIIAELPANIQPTINVNNDLPNALQVKENDSPAENPTEKPCKSMPDKSLQELNSAGGDADINNLCSKESEKNTCKCGRSFEINKEIGSGDT